jgi:hypothetical protein
MLLGCTSAGESFALKRLWNRCCRGALEAATFNQPFAPSGSRNRGVHFQSRLALILGAFLLSSCQKHALSMDRSPSTRPFAPKDVSLFLPMESCRETFSEADCRTAKEAAQTWKKQPGVEDERVRLFVTGDVGKRTDDPRESHPDAKLVRGVGQAVCGKTCTSALFLGDNLYSWGIKNDDDTRFLKNFTSHYLGPEAKPDFVSSVYFVQGNHDWNPLFPSRDRAQNLHRDITYHLGPRVHGDAHFWHAKMGPLRAVSLDSNHLVRNCRPKWASGSPRVGAGNLPLGLDQPELWGAHDIECPESEVPGSRAVDLAGIERIVGEQGREDTVVVGHHPWFGNGLHGTAGWYRDFSCSFPMSLGRAHGAAPLCEDVFSGKAYRVVLERVVRPRAALYLSGHDHAAQVHLSSADPGLLSVVVGSGSKVSPAGRRTKVSEGYHQRDMVLQAHCHLGFAVVERSSRGLLVQVYSFRGSGTDACTGLNRTRAAVRSRGEEVELPNVSPDLDLHCQGFRLSHGSWTKEQRCRSLDTW